MGQLCACPCKRRSTSLTHEDEFTGQDCQMMARSKRVVSYVYCCPLVMDIPSRWTSCGFNGSTTIDAFSTAAPHPALRPRSGFLCRELRTRSRDRWRPHDSHPQRNLLLPRRAETVVSGPRDTQCLSRSSQTLCARTSQAPLVVRTLHPSAFRQSLD